MNGTSGRLCAAGCGSTDASFGFGAPKKPPAFWLCYQCWLLTPDGQRQAMNYIKGMTLDEHAAADDEAGQAVDGDEREADGPA
jgi:hypothetical protein